MLLTLPIIKFKDTSWTYRKWGKIRWAKLSGFSRFSRVPQKFFHEYNRLSLTVLNNEHLWPRQCESISVKTSTALQPQMFSPANLSLSTVEFPRTADQCNRLSDVHFPAIVE